jgi:hypothetical protein
MADEKTFADEVRQRADDDSPHFHQEPDRRGLTAVIKHRWPTWLAIAFAVLVAFDLEDGSALYFLLFILALGYIAAAALNRRWIPWAVLVLSIPAVDAMKALGIEPAVGLLITTLIFLVLGFAGGQVQAPWGMPLQTASMFAFGALGLAALFVDPDLGGYLVAAGLIGHGVWDIVHYWANRVVVRSFAEWCAVYDILLGAAILFIT